MDFPAATRSLNSHKLGYLLYEVKAIEMNERVVLVAIRYLAIAVALLHTSLGAKPTLRVVYRVNDIDNKNELECLVGGFVRSGAIFTFKEPGTETVEDSIMERRFTIHPSNESLVTCTIDSEESDPVRVAGMCNKLVCYHYSHKYSNYNIILLLQLSLSTLV